MEITSFALFGWSMALASILFFIFIFIYKKARRTTATGAGLRSNDGSADPDVKIVGQDEKYKRSTWGICIGRQHHSWPNAGICAWLGTQTRHPDLLSYRGHHPQRPLHMLCHQRKHRKGTVRKIRLQ